MRNSRLAGLTGATALVLGIVLPVPTASAVEATTIYVDPHGCSDSGSGTQAVPFCTISAAAGAALPGQTVMVAGNWRYTEAVNITRSGEPGRPIVFAAARTAAGQYSSLVYPPSGSGPTFTFSGVHDVVVQNFWVHANTSAFLVKDSSQVRIDGTLGVTQIITPSPLVRLTGATHDVTISRNRFRAPATSGIQIDSGVRNTVVTTNLLGGTATQVQATDAPGTVITGNTIDEKCGTPIRLTGASIGSAIHNNVVSNAGDGPSCATYGPVVTVSTESAQGTTLDHNLVQGGGLTPYDWAGRPYQASAALASATGQGTHDIVGDPKFAYDGSNTPLSLSTSSPAIDSADDSAPGALDTDVNGRPLVDDPQVSDTGTGRRYRDRGAVEVQSAIPDNVRVQTGPAPYPLKVTATTNVWQNWPAGITYSTDFGDGTVPVVSDKPTADHTYTRAGSFTVTTTTTDPAGHSYTVAAESPVTVNEPGQPKLTFTALQCTDARTDGCGLPLAYVIDTTGTTSPWPIADYRVDYGDGTPTSSNPGQVHVYNLPGDYAVTVTVTDQGGQTATLTKTVTVGYAAGSYWSTLMRVLDTRQGAHPVRLAPGDKLTFNPSGVSQTNQTAVVLNVTAVDPAGSGHLSVAPGGTPRPTSSNINYLAGQTVPNLVTVPVGSDDTVTIWNSPGGAPVDVVVDYLGGYDTTNRGGLFNPLPPTRVLDTRDGTGRPAGKISSLCWGSQYTPVQLKLGGPNGVPANATAVVLNLTVTNPDQDGNLGVGTPFISNLNFTKGQTVSNQVIAPVGSDGTVTFCNNSGTLDLVADLSGYYAPDSGSLFTPVLPTRTVDTRLGTNPAKLGPFSTLSASAGAPAGATAAVLNVTSTNSQYDSYLTVWADGTARPGTSSVNFPAGKTVPNHVITPLGANGKFDIFNHVGSTDVIADVFGYFTKR